MSLSSFPPVVQEEPEGVDPIRAEIGRALMVVREKENLLKLLERIKAFREEIPVPDIVTDNLLLTAEMISRSALLRKESRGIHYREDFPNTDPSYAKPSFINKEKQDEMNVFLR